MININYLLYYNYLYNCVASEDSKLFVEESPAFEGVCGALPNDAVESKEIILRLLAGKRLLIIIIIIII